MVVSPEAEARHAVRLLAGCSAADQPPPSHYAPLSFVTISSVFTFHLFLPSRTARQPKNAEPERIFMHGLTPGFGAEWSLNAQKPDTLSLEAATSGRIRADEAAQQLNEDWDPSPPPHPIPLAAFAAPRRSLSICREACSIAASWLARMSSVASLTVVFTGPRSCRAP